MPDDATVPMRRSDHPPSMPPEDAWGGDAEKEKDVSAAQTRENPAQTASPNPPPAAASPKPAPVAASPSPKPAPVAASPSVKPPPVAAAPSGRPPPLPTSASAAPPAAASPAQVVTDANSLRLALEEILGPMQRSIDDLTVRLARERVDRKEAIEKLERTVARVASATPPPAQVAPGPPAQPFQVSPSANPPPVAPVAAAPAPSPVPPAAAPSPAPPVAAKPPSPKPPPVVQKQVPTEPPSQPLNLDVIEAEPRRIELDKYSTDLGFDLPPGLDTGKRRKRMLVFVFLVVIGGVVAIVASAIISQSRGAGHSQLETRASRASLV